MGKRRGPKFIQITADVLLSPAYRGLSGWAAKALNLICLGHNGSNNGGIAYADRKLAAALGTSRRTAQRALVEPENAGFIRSEDKGCFNRKRHATRWRLTFIDCESQPATHDYQQAAGVNHDPL